MKKSLRSINGLLLLGIAALLTGPVQAGNSAVEATLQSFGDLSSFQQALINTGVVNELSEQQHYTIFAPTNAALAQINPQTYPCFYAPQCRPQIAALLRSHIVLGRHDTPTLVTYGQGVQSLNGTLIHVREPYVGNYTVDNRAILSKTEANGNVIYRVDGVLANPAELAQLQTAGYVPLTAQLPVQSVIVPTTTIASQRSMVTYDPSTTPLQPNPSHTAPGQAADLMPDNATETTTVITGYTTTAPVAP